MTYLQAEFRIRNFTNSKQEW